MKLRTPLSALALLSATPVVHAATPVIEPLGMESYKLDWEGEAGITYFIQWSLDLQTWQYFPVIDHGEDHEEFNFSSSAPWFFVRLATSDIPTTDPYGADFDGDGLSNIFEVTYGYDPFEVNSTGGGSDGSLDPDEDGLGNASEEAAGSDPTSKDHPDVELSVTVGN